MIKRSRLRDLQKAKVATEATGLCGVVKNKKQRFSTLTLKVDIFRDTVLAPCK
jgi:hypothetical protein